MYVAYHLSLFVFVNIDRYINDFSIAYLLGSNIRVSIVLFFLFLIPVIVIVFHVTVVFGFLLLVIGSFLETDVTFFQGT